MLFGAACRWRRTPLCLLLKVSGMPRVHDINVVDSRNAGHARYLSLGGTSSWAATVRERSARIRKKRMSCFITFARYGCNLHGDESGSVDQSHNLPGSRELEADPQRVSTERRLMRQAPYSLDRNGRMAVLAALKEVCLYRGWRLLARISHGSYLNELPDAVVARALLPAVSALVPTLCSREDRASRRVSTRQARVPAPRYHSNL
jgi:hypothetical protein